MTKIFIILFSFFSVLLFGNFSNAIAQEHDIRNDLDTLVTGLMQRNNLPSVVPAVFIPGKAEYIIVKGKANLATGLDRKAGDQYRIGSITKTFIATVILQLSDSGKISVSDKLSKWFPEFPNADIITINDLLMMRSGIYDSWDHEILEKYYKDPMIKLTADEMIRLSAEKPFEFKKPDTEGVYCNINYILLEKIIEKITGKKIATVLDEFIFKPLGMTNSIYPVTTNLPGNLHGYSWNYDTKIFEDKTSVNPDPVGGAGAVISDIHDLNIYARALYTGHNLLNPETQKQRLESKPFKGIPDFIQYGEGIIKFGNFYGHNGTICGFSSGMFYQPDNDATIIVNVSRLDLDDKSQSSVIFEEVAKYLFPNVVNW